MQFPLFTRSIGAAILLTPFALAIPVCEYNLFPRDTAELYIFANCFNNITHASYAAIFWYYPDFLPDYPEPQLTAIVNSHHAVQYAGRFTNVTSPFILKATIPKNATTAAAETLVSNDVSASSFAGPMAAFKGSGLVFDTPATYVNCVEEYYQQDVSSEYIFVVQSYD